METTNDDGTRLLRQLRHVGRKQIILPKNPVRDDMSVEDGMSVEDDMSVEKANRSPERIPSGMTCR
jgi:hypothetical protein